MNPEVIQFIREIVPGEQLLTDEPMQKHTTFRVGGPAKVYVEITDVQQLSRLINYFYRNQVPYFILGNGSNLLVGDLGYDGVMIKIGAGMNQITVTEKIMTVGAGALLSRTAAIAAAGGLSGLEFASGIPGSLGGAIVMNAGAYDGEMKNVVSLVTVMDEHGDIRTFSRDEMKFGYRTSVIKQRPYIVLSAELELEFGDTAEIQAKMEDFNSRRREKQPLEYPSAGSTFKRPEGYYAGKLIMEAGLRGYRVGGAQVSEKHCGFVINIGNATAADISELMIEVQQIVKEKFGVMLEPEVIQIGEF